MEYQLPYIALELTIMILSIAVAIRLFVDSARGMQLNILRSSTQWLDSGDKVPVRYGAHERHEQRPWQLVYCESL